MAITLYDLTVSSYLQVLGGMKGVLQKGADHCKANNIDPQTIVDGRMIDDMLPFSFQVAAVAHHSIGAIEGLKKGVFPRRATFRRTTRASRSCWTTPRPA